MADRALETPPSGAAGTRRRRSGQKERPAAALQPDVRRARPRSSHHRGSAHGSGGCTLAPRRAARGGRRLSRFRRHPRQSELLACASHDHANVYSLGGKRGGSLEDPSSSTQSRRRASATRRATRSATGMTLRGFTWDGRSSSSAGSPEAAPRRSARRPIQTSRRARSSITSRTARRSGVRPPAAADGRRELHDPQLRRRADEEGYYLVGGNYQAGISVVNFSKPSRAKRSRTPTRRRSCRHSWGTTGSPTGTRARLPVGHHPRPARLGSEKEHRQDEELRHLNPQTIEFSLSKDRKKRDKDRR